MADLEGEQAAWFERFVGLGDEAAIDVQTGLAGEEGRRRFVVADLRMEGGSLDSGM